MARKRKAQVRVEGLYYHEAWKRYPVTLVLSTGQWVMFDDVEPTRSIIWTKEKRPTDARRVVLDELPERYQRKIREEGFGDIPTMAPVRSVEQAELF